VFDAPLDAVYVWIALGAVSLVVAGTVFALPTASPAAAAAVAERHDVPVGLPDWMELGREKLSAPAESASTVLAGTAYETRQLLATNGWEEALVVDERGGTAVVPEALGTLPAFGREGTSLGLHPGLEEPPEGLADLSPERLLVGHGESVSDDAAGALDAALAE